MNHSRVKFNSFLCSGGLKSIFNVADLSEWGIVHAMMPSEYGASEGLFYLDVDFIYQCTSGGTDVVSNHIYRLITDDISKVGMEG